MTHVVVGVFDDTDKIAQVRRELLGAGFTDSEVSVRTQESSAADVNTVNEKETGGVAHFFRSLFGLESDNEHTGLYSEAVRRNHSVVTVNASDDSEADRAEEILDRCGAIDVDERSEQWRREGWSSTGASASATSESMQSPVQRADSSRRGGVRTFLAARSQGSGSWESNGDHDADFRQHWTENFGSSGNQYDEYAPAYKYGSTLAGSGQYTGRTWDEIEPEARQDWEKQYPGNAWDRFKESVRYGWEKLTGAGHSGLGGSSQARSPADPQQTSP
jgi:hypothetical protein